MSWFGKSKASPEEQASAEQNSVQVVVHKNARKEVIESAKEVNKQLTKLFNDNHFTITILLAAGGKPPNRKVQKRGH